MNIIEKLALIIIFISVVKLIGMFAFKKFFNEFVKSYIQSIGKNPWMYFIVYYSLSIIVLSIILNNTKITYTEITAIMIFFSFFINAGFISINPNIYEKLDMSKIDWPKCSLYLALWLTIMYKALKEIFNF